MCDITKSQVVSKEVPISMQTVQGFEALQRVAKLFAASDIVPEAYRNNIPNTVIALDLAARLGVSPIAIMQQLYIVHGKPAWVGQFMIASFNRSGKFETIHYDFVGEEGNDDWGCRACTARKDGTRITGPVVTIAMAKGEGWYGKNKKWQTMPELMLMYRAAAWLVRTCAPEIAMGIYTVDEIQDTVDLVKSDGVYAPERTEMPQNSVKSSELHDVSGLLKKSKEEAIVEEIEHEEEKPAEAQLPLGVNAPATQYECPKTETLVDSDECFYCRDRLGCPEHIAEGDNNE